MRTMYRTKPEYAEAFLRIIDETDTSGEFRPEHFKKVMRENQGGINAFSPYGTPDDGLERKNPVIVALGDSVTAGHFEPCGNLEEIMSIIEAGGMPDFSAGEITDARECYLEKFRSLLIDYFEQTSVSTINAGIAGDTMLGMEKRVYRDVVRYQPDLVIINGSLNWGEENGDSDDYEAALRRVLAVIQQETKADIILMTPNMEKMPDVLKNPKSPLIERVEIIRKLAREKHCCLADTYLAWEKYEEAGYPAVELLANRGNHLSVTGHEGFAKVLMKLVTD